MASSNTTADAQETYSKMAVGDVEAVGAHCQMAFCHQLDFLPFKCGSCNGKFCLDHRTETAHQCPEPGAWARRRQQALAPTSTGYKGPTKPNILNHEQQCSEPSCKILINTPLTTGVQCDKCNRSYCLKHRFTYEHNCSNLTPLGARPAGTTQKEKGLAALEKLKAWGAAKKASLPKAPQSSSRQAAAARVQGLTNLKKTAKGDDKIPVDKRVYVFVEASSDTISAKIPKGSFYYNMDYTVGRVLDLAAKGLQVNNTNNRVSGEEDRLRIFHVEGGRLLEFNERIGQAVQTGNTIVLLRGVGSGMVKTPDNVN